MLKIKSGRTPRFIMALACAMIILQLTGLSVSVSYACYPPTGTLSVEADVGSIHFRGEIAEFYILVSYLGKPIDAEIGAVLYYNGSLHANLNASVEHVATGLYRVSYTIPMEASAGTYALVVNASRCRLAGTTLKTFLLSSTLTSWNAWIIEIQGDLAIIRTDVGEIKVSLEALEARLVSIDGRIATIETDLGIIKVDLDNIKTDIGSIQTDTGEIKLTLKSINGTMVTIQSNIGEIQVTLSQINATLNALNGTVAIIQTSIGTIETSIEDIRLEITAIKGDIATISTTLGDINGTIVSIEGDIANIKTDLGEVKASLPPAPITTIGIPFVLIFAVIAAVASTISAVLLLRRRKARR